MNQSKREALERAGFAVGSVADFLGLTDAESGLVELRLRLCRTIRRLREGAKLTQQQVADQMESSQSRVAKIEAGEGDVSLDLLFRCLFTVGGDLATLAEVDRPKRVRRKADKTKPVAT